MESVIRRCDITKLSGFCFVYFASFYFVKIKNFHSFQCQMDVDTSRGEGFRSYYITKIEELQLVVAEKSQNLRRLQAQRNELNAKGKLMISFENEGQEIRQSLNAL